MVITLIWSSGMSSFMSPMFYQTRGIWLNLLHVLFLSALYFALYHVHLVISCRSGIIINQFVWIIIFPFISCSIYLWSEFFLCGFELVHTLTFMKFFFPLVLFCPCSFRILGFVFTKLFHNWNHQYLLKCSEFLIRIFVYDEHFFA